MENDGPSPRSLRQREHEPAAPRALYWFAALLLSSMLASRLHLPWKLLAVVFGMAALVLGAVALVEALRQHQPSLVKAGLALGLAAALLLTFGNGIAVLLWPATAEFERCTSTALTISAMEACDDGLRNLRGLLP